MQANFDEEKEDDQDMVNASQLIEGSYSLHCRNVKIWRRSSLYIKLYIYNGVDIDCFLYI